MLTNQWLRQFRPPGTRMPGAQTPPGQMSGAQTPPGLNPTDTSWQVLLGMWNSSVVYICVKNCEKREDGWLLLKQKKATVPPLCG